MLSDPPAYGEIRTGWYQIDGYWYLTLAAAKKELGVTTKQFEKHLLGVATETLVNQYNERPFIVYSLESLRLRSKRVYKTI